MSADEVKEEEQKKQKISLKKVCDSLKWHCKHQDELDSRKTLYCHNTGNNWGKICGAFLLLWTGIGLFFFAMLALLLEFGEDLLWGYLALFIAFFVVVVIAVGLGHIQFLKEKKAEEAADAQRAALMAAENEVQ